MGKLVGCEYMGGGGGWGQEGTILIPIAIAGLISTLIRGTKLQSVQKRCEAILF